MAPAQPAKLRSSVREAGSGTVTAAAGPANLESGDKQPALLNMIGDALNDGSKIIVAPAPIVRAYPEGKALAEVTWSVPLLTVVPPV